MSTDALFVERLGVEQRVKVNSDFVFEFVDLPRILSIAKREDGEGKYEQDRVIGDIQLNKVELALVLCIISELKLLQAVSQLVKKVGGKEQKNDGNEFEKADNDEFALEKRFEDGVNVNSLAIQLIYLIFLLQLEERCV